MCSVPSLQSPAPSSHCYLGTDIGHACVTSQFPKIPHSHFTTQHRRLINEASAGAAVFSEQSESVHRSELMENTVVSPEKFWHQCPKCSTRFKIEPSGSVLPKHEIIIENRKSTELGESSASGHHAFSCERKMLAFAYTKCLRQS